MPAMERRVDVVEEIPDVAHHHAADLILGHDAMDDEAEGHQHPRQVRRSKDQQAEKAEAGLGVAPAPDVHQARGQGGAEERKREEWREDQEGGHGVDEEPREVGRGAAG